MNRLSDSPPPYGTVVFDCDSTLSRIEGIEQLARDCREQVEHLTQRAMDGELPLEAVYAARLEQIAPCRADLERVAELYFSERLPHAQELVAALQALGKRVHVVSGGLQPAVAPFARRLGVIDDGRVQAVAMQFDQSGAYAGFDEASPLARGGGKIGVLRQIAGAPGAGPVALIGDGVTDLEAAPEVQRFIAYGGVASRARVLQAARVSCQVADLAALVPLLFSSEEREQLRACNSHSRLLDAAATHA